jgi:NADH-quinone oxidoreductase subunit E
MPEKKEELKKEPSLHEIEEKVLSVIEIHSEDKSPLLPILQDVQKEIGFISPDAMLIISETLDVPLSQVYSAVTFYNDFKTEKRGRHLLRVCMGTACCLKKGETLLFELEKEIGVKAGATSEDGLFTLETVNCFGACSLGPILEVDGRIYSKIEIKKARSICQELRRGDSEA